MDGPKVLALILAGGEGARLHPLTTHRSKPSVPFGGKYRIVDFVLSNFINSHVYSIYLLVQYKSQSLIEHVSRAWGLSPIVTGHFVTVVPPQMREGAEWFQGTADAVFQNLNLVHMHRPDVVAIFGADHIYRMDVRQMVAFHRQQRADVSVAALRVPLSQASSFGLIEAEHDGRIRAFREKPAKPEPLPDDAEHAYASMGNYLFNGHVLQEALEEAHRRGEKDFALDVLPRLLVSHRVYAYDFTLNQVPGIKPYESAGYWRDVGTIEAYFNAHQDLLGPTPHFDLFNPQWPIRTSNYDGPTAMINSGTITRSTLGSGTRVDGAVVRDSVVRREVVLEPGVELEQCIIMDYVLVRRGSRLRRTIVDRYNVIPPNTQVGYDIEADHQRYHVDGCGVVVVPQGRRRIDMVY